MSRKDLCATAGASGVCEALLDTTWSNDFMLSVKYTGKKKNQCSMTALHKEPLCLDISFLLAYFCLGCSESLCMPGGLGGGAVLQRTMWGSSGMCYLFSVAFRRHLHRSFHTATPSITADRLLRVHLQQELWTVDAKLLQNTRLMRRVRMISIQRDIIFGFSQFIWCLFS